MQHYQKIEGGEQCKTILLTRTAPYEIFFANRLFESGVLNEVIVEDRPWPKNDKIRLVDPLIQFCLLHPKRAIEQTVVLLNRCRFYGHKKKHNHRLLNNGFKHFDTNLPVEFVKDINGATTFELLQSKKPDIVFVFGTQLLNKKILTSIDAPFVNLHWGWSPDYRDDGIVSALALEGIPGLGVTVHLIDEGIDTGDILYRARPEVDCTDNFYSIGLKLAILAVDLFIQVTRDFVARGVLSGIKQINYKSQLFSTSVLRNKPNLYLKAWHVLRSSPILNK